MRGGSLPKVGRFLKSFLSYDALLNLSLPFLGVSRSSRIDMECPTRTD